MGILVWEMRWDNQIIRGVDNSVKSCFTAILSALVQCIKESCSGEQCCVAEVSMMQNFLRNSAEDSTGVSSLIAKTRAVFSEFIQRAAIFELRAKYVTIPSHITTVNASMANSTLCDVGFTVSWAPSYLPLTLGQYMAGLLWRVADLISTPCGDVEETFGVKDTIQITPRSSRVDWD